MSTSNIAIFASGSGTNAEEIIKYLQHNSTIKVSALLSNNPDAYALERAKKYTIPTYVFNREEFRNPDHLLPILHRHDVTHIVLAGFLWLVPAYLIKEFPGKIINIHPALLPRYGGKGMYGMVVHEAVKAAGDPETGITIHHVNEKFDDGEIIFQARCTVTPDDTAEMIAANVHKLEYAHYPKVIERWIKDK